LYSTVVQYGGCKILELRYVDGIKISKKKFDKKIIVRLDLEDMEFIDTFVNTHPEFSTKSDFVRYVIHTFIMERTNKIDQVPVTSGIQNDQLINSILEDRQKSNMELYPVKIGLNIYVRKAFYKYLLDMHPSAISFSETYLNEKIEELANEGFSTELEYLLDRKNNRDKKIIEYSKGDKDDK
jgi:Arc/MetJ-type ribon-helix-helix transcriptional regulator